MIPTVVRGHLARPGSPAEAYLVAWSELRDRAPDPDVLRAELASVRAWRRSLERNPDPYYRAAISRRGRWWPEYRAHVRILAPAIARAVELQELLGWLWALATTSAGYLGEEARP